MKIIILKCINLVIWCIIVLTLIINVFYVENEMPEQKSAIGSVFEWSFDVFLNPVALLIGVMTFGYLIYEIVTESF